MITALLLVTFTASTAAGNVVWVCSGPQLKLTYITCNIIGDKGISHGCFYLEHFAQYRPCSKICKGVELHSIAEARCNANCPEFLTSNCQPSDQIPSSTTALTASSLKTVNPSATRRYVTKGSLRTQPAVDSTGVIIGVVAVVMVLLILVTLLIVCRRSKKKLKSAKDEECFKPAEKQQGVQPEQPIYGAGYEGEGNVDVNYDQEKMNPKTGEPQLFDDGKITRDQHPLYMETAEERKEREGETLVDIESETKP